MSDFEIKLTDNSGEILKELQDKIPTVLEAWGLQAERHGKEYCPVDTGRLRNSITHAPIPNENAEAIGTNVSYAVPVETGHILPNGGYVAPKPFIKPAVENHISEYQAIAKKCLSN